MSFLKAAWWKPAAALAVLALAVLVLSLSGAGTAQAGGAGTVTIDPMDKDIGAGGQGDVAIKIDPPAAGTSIWIVQVKYDPAVAQVKLDAQQNPVCTFMANPGGGIAQAAGCDIKASGDHGVENDTAVAFGGWVQNDNGTPRGFMTEQVAATFTFVAVGASGAHTDLVTTVTSLLGPNGEVGAPAASNGRINITSGQTLTWGNSDCSADGVTSRDSQAVLKNVLQKTPLSQETGCPAVGASVTVASVARTWGNWDCSADGVTSRDSQAILKNVLQKTPLSQEQGCPAVGASVTVS